MWKQFFLFPISYTGLWWYNLIIYVNIKWGVYLHTVQVIYKQFFLYSKFLHFSIVYSSDTEEYRIEFKDALIQNHLLKFIHVQVDICGKTKKEILLSTGTVS